MEATLKLGNSELIVHIPGREDMKMSEARSCCGIAYPEPEPSLFSFNSPLGMCPACNGIGTLLSMDPDKIVPDPTLTIRQGAVVPWKNYFLKKSKYNDHNNAWGLGQLLAMEEQWGIGFDTPWKDLPKKQQDLILKGAGNRTLTVTWNSEKIKGEVERTHEGVMNTLMRRYRTTQSEGAKKYYANFMAERTCTACGGKRLKPEVLHVFIEGKSIIDITEMTIRQAHDFIRTLELSGNKQLIAGELLKEITNRLGFLVNVGAGLSLPGSQGSHPVRGGIPAHPPGLPGGIGTHRGALYPGRTLHWPAPKGQCQALENPAPFTGHRQHPHCGGA